MPGFEPSLFIIQVVVLLLGFTVHEYAHAVVADAAGDPTPRFYGRVTLNPLAHLDPTGTMFMLVTIMTGYGIGWGKPVPVNPGKMRNPRWDHFWSVAAGPLSNLLQASCYAVLLRGFQMIGPSGLAPQVQVFLMTFFWIGVMLNLGMFLFNLIPLGPLDGHWLFGAFLPDRERVRWYQWNRTYGSGVLLLLLMMGWVTSFNLIGSLLYPGMRFFSRLLTGMNL